MTGHFRLSSPDYCSERGIAYILSEFELLNAVTTEKELVGSNDSFDDADTDADGTTFTYGVLSSPIFSHPFSPQTVTQSREPVPMFDQSVWFHKMYT